MGGFQTQSSDSSSIINSKANESAQFDANNNGGSLSNQEQADSFKDCSRRFNASSESGNVTLRSQTESLNSTSLDNEDWHLLDADESKILIHDGGQNQNINNKMTYTNLMNVNNNNNDNEKPVTRSDKKYIDIDPLGGRGSYTPSMIYLCTAIYSLLPVASIIATFSLVALLFTKFYFITLVYFSYVLYDRNTCNKGGRRLDFVYRSKFWSYLAAYFPIKIRHSTDFKLDPSKNYILNYSPHGISAFGAVTAFGTNGLILSELFPGITTRFMVHETSFVVPIMKETFALRGDCSVNSKSIDHMLTRQKTGNLLTIVVGGLAEADLSNEEVLKIVVAERKGFVKKALIHGAHIIPCIAFGENSVFHKVDLEPSSLMYRLQNRWYELFKFKHPVYFGQSIFFENSKGVMPFKRPITVVMGDPIKIEKVDKPTQSEIDRVHSQYLNELRAMYKANSDLCSEYDRKLELV